MSIEQLLIDYEAHKTARTDDPDTSKVAAHRSRTERMAHRGLILAALDGWPMGLTYTELATVTTLEKHAVGRRLSELGNEDLVERAVLDGRPLMRLTDSGCYAHVVRITDAGKQVLRSQQK